MSHPELNATVISRMDVTPQMIILRIAPDGWELPEFHAGQYAMVGLPSSAPRCDNSEPESDQSDRFLTRSYSVASSAKPRSFVEFFITLVPDGAMSPRIFALQTGDKVWLSKNMTGFFTFQKVPENSNVILLATGSGISPCMGMVRTHLTLHSGRRIILVHGSRSSNELAYRSELIALDRMIDNFNYVETISRPDDEPVKWQGRTGYIQDVWRDGTIDSLWGFHPSPDNTHVFVSGNPAMCDEVTKLLVDESFSEHTFKEPGELHLERFW